MNQQHRDILTAIGRQQPITTAGIAEYLMDHFGYGGGMEFDAFRDQVSKTIGYLKNKGEIVGEDIPQAKGKPLRYWALANPNPDSKPAEMASDVAEIDEPVQEPLTVSDTVTPEPSVSVEVKIEQKMPITVHQAMVAVWNESLEPEDVLAFMRGIEFAEKHHGISQ